MLVLKPVRNNTSVGRGNGRVDRDVGTSRAHEMTNHVALWLEKTEYFLRRTKEKLADSSKQSPILATPAPAIPASTATVPGPSHPIPPSLALFAHPPGHAVCLWDIVSGHAVFSCANIQFLLIWKCVQNFPTPSRSWIEINRKKRYCEVWIQVHLFSSLV